MSYESAFSLTSTSTITGFPSTVEINQGTLAVELNEPSSLPVAASKTLTLIVSNGIATLPTSLYSAVALPHVLE